MTLLKHPSAWIPIALSLAVLGTMITTFMIGGVPVRQADEGTAAHLFQIWFVLEALLILFFAVRWLPRRDKDAFIVLTIQVIAVLLACAPVFYFKL